MPRRLSVSNGPELLPDGERLPGFRVDGKYFRSKVIGKPANPLAPGRKYASAVFRLERAGAPPGGETSEAALRGEGEFAPAGTAARRLLAERGLRDDVVAGAHALIEQVQAIQPVAVPQLDRERERQAEDALWAWYLEWSAIARVAVRDRRMLRAMGFLGGKRRTDTEEGATEAGPAVRAGPT